MTDLTTPQIGPRALADPGTQWGVAAASSRSVAIIITDHDGMILAWNAGAQDMFGYNACDMIGRSMLAVVDSSASSEAAESSLDPFFDNGHSRWYRHRSGRRVFCMARMSILGAEVDGSGRRALFLCNVTEIRERFDALLSRLIAQEVRCDEALNADAYKDRCIALISHELKQPLTMILMVIERLLEVSDDAREQRTREDLRDLRGATRRMTRIVDDLLELSRARAGKIRLEPILVNVDELVRDVSAAMAESAPDRSIIVDIEGSDYGCIGDPVRMEQIVSNLLHNAIKFSESGGRIHVCVGADDGFAKIAVADDGVGISREFLPHVFSMFDQELGAHPSTTDGLGIGLAVVNELVKAHAGRISVLSEGLGRGAKFTVWLPLARKSMSAQFMSSPAMEGLA